MKNRLEEYQNGTVFKICTFNTISHLFVKVENIKEFNKQICQYLPLEMYFVKTENNELEEIYSKRIFVIKDNNFINIETGVFIPCKQVYETYMKDYGEKVRQENKKYYNCESFEILLKRFFDICEELQNDDIEYKSRLNYMLLKRGLKLNNV